jgi:hypothetical protein
LSNQFFEKSQEAELDTAHTEPHKKQGDSQEDAVAEYPFGKARHIQHICWDCRCLTRTENEVLGLV